MSDYDPHAWPQFKADLEVHLARLNESQLRDVLRESYWTAWGECRALGDLDWPAELHLSDVIEKHLARPVSRRIMELETTLVQARDWIDGELSRNYPGLQDTWQRSPLFRAIDAALREESEH